MQGLCWAIVKTVTVSGNVRSAGQGLEGYSLLAMYCSTCVGNESFVRTPIRAPLLAMIRRSWSIIGWGVLCDDYNKCNI